MTLGIYRSLRTSSLKTRYTIRAFIEVIEGRFLSRRTYYIRLKPVMMPNTALLSCQRKHKTLITISANAKSHKSERFFVLSSMS